MNNTQTFAVGEIIGLDDPYFAQTEKLIRLIGEKGPFVVKQIYNLTTRCCGHHSCFYKKDFKTRDGLDYKIPTLHDTKCPCRAIPKYVTPDGMGSLCHTNQVLVVQTLSGKTLKLAFSQCWFERLYFVPERIVRSILEQSKTLASAPGDIKKMSDDLDNQKQSLQQVFYRVCSTNSALLDLQRVFPESK